MTHELSSIWHRRFGASAPTDVAALVRPVLVGLGMAVAFITVFLAALHNPNPHGLEIAVVGTTQEAGQVSHGLEKAAPGSFRVRSYDTPAAAKGALLDRDVYGVLDLTPGQPVKISYAGANGAGVTSAVVGALAATAAYVGGPVTSIDAVPLPSGDSRGLSVFYFVFGLALSAFLFAMTVHQLAAGAAVFVRVGLAVAFAGISGIVLAGIADFGFSALTGHFWAVAGISAMISLAVSTVTSALTRLCGGAGIALAGVLAIVVGNATSGGALNWHFLPGGWRWLSQQLPSGAGVSGLVDVQYFDAAHLGPALVTLSTWIGVSLLFIVVLPLLRLDAVHRAHHHGRHERANHQPQTVS